MMMRRRRRRTTTANHSRRKTFFSYFFFVFAFFRFNNSCTFSFFSHFFQFLVIVLHDFFIVHLLTNPTVRQEVRQSHVLDVVAWGPCTRIPAKSLRDE